MIDLWILSSKKGILVWSTKKKKIRLARPPPTIIIINYMIENQVTVGGGNNMEMADNQEKIAQTQVLL